MNLRGVQAVFGRNGNAACTFPCLYGLHGIVPPTVFIVD